MARTPTPPPPTVAPTTTGNPVQSGSMYLAWSNTRMGYVALRWAKAVGFLTLNGAVGTFVYQSFEMKSVKGIAVLFTIALVVMYANRMWLRLTWRTNDWIAYYAKKLEEMENAFGTESGVRMFSDQKYLSRPQDEATGSTASKHSINELATVMLVLWSIAGAYLFTCAVVLATRGQWW